MKVNITLDDELMKEVDDFAEKNFMSRSGLLSLAVTQYINANKAVFAMQDLALAMRKIADTNEMDDDTKEKLDDFERTAKFLMGSGAFGK